jgi:hypothetical protein
MQRRQFLRSSVLATVGILTASAISRVYGAVSEKLDAFKGGEVFDRILKKAEKEKWAAMPMSCRRITKCAR